MARMNERQDPSDCFTPPFKLEVRRLGPLPIINHFIEKLGIEPLLDKHVPANDPRCSLPYSKALGVLLRSIIVEREPIYRQQEFVRGFWAPLFGITNAQVERLGDDKVGRALDRQFRRIEGRCSPKSSLQQPSALISI